MAEVIISEAEVIREIPNYGFVVTESRRDRNGEERKSYYTVWTDEKVEIGEKISVRGLLSVKLDEYTTREGEKKQTAQASINNPKIKKADDVF